MSQNKPFLSLNLFSGVFYYSNRKQIQSQKRETSRYQVPLDKRAPLTPRGSLKTLNLGLIKPPAPLSICRKHREQRNMCTSNKQSLLVELAQVIEHLPSTHQTFLSNPPNCNKKKKKKDNH
jgi:hypothetical protein